MVPLCPPPPPLVGQAIKKPNHGSFSASDRVGFGLRTGTRRLGSVTRAARGALGLVGADELVGLGHQLAVLVAAAALAQAEMITG